MKTGTELITEERQRQIEKEGFTSNHDDDRFHKNGELAAYACCLASPKRIFLLHYKPQHDHISFTDPYPALWDLMFDKRKREDRIGALIPNEELPKPDRIRNLVKAGALIAAEIDRLQRTIKG